MRECLHWLSNIWDYFLPIFFEICWLVSNYQKLSEMIRDRSCYVSSCNFLLKSLWNILSISFFELAVILSWSANGWGRTMMHTLRWPIAATAKTKRNTVNKENLTNKKVLLTYNKGLLPYKQDLISYTKKEFAYKYKKPTANNHSKFLRQILTANFCGKFPPQIPAANSHGKFSRQNPAAYSRGKFSRQILENVM